MSFSPFSFCWKFDYFQSKWRVARYNTTIRDDTNNKKEEYDEYFAEGCISESNNYYLYMFMTSLRREPIRGHQNCPIATTWCRIKCVLTKIGPFKNTGYLIITKSLKFGFSLFCRVLLLALFFFSYLFLFRVYFVVTNDITILPASLVCITDCYQKWVLLKPLENLVIYNWKGLSYFQRPTANIIKKAYNATE